MNKPEFLANSPEARDLANHMHPYTNPVALKAQGAHIINKGEGVFVHDNQGKSYIEGLARTVVCLFRIQRARAC